MTKRVLTVAFLLATLMSSYSQAQAAPYYAPETTLTFDEQLALNFARGAARNIAFEKYCGLVRIDPREMRTAVRIAGAEQIRIETDKVERQYETMGRAAFCRWGFQVLLKAGARLDGAQMRSR
jgi:hypothetical protein